MDEEMRMLQLDKPGQGKSMTEIQKHSIDEASFANKNVERAIFILSRGDDLQKLSVISSLPELLSIDRNGTLSKLMPKIQQELPNASSEFNLAASKMFSILINMEVPANLIPQVLQGLEHKDPIIANAWMETLLSIIPILKESTIKHEILKCAISKSQLSKAAYFRVSSCRILGKLALHPSMSSFDVKKDILPLVQSLCQDCFHEVRAAMCKEIPSVAKGLFSLGDVIVKVNLLPLLVELSSDENLYVRSVAIDSVVMTVQYLSLDTIKGTIIPLIKKLCTRSVSEGDTTYTAIAYNYQKLIVSILPQLTNSDAVWFLDYFAHISKKGFSITAEIDTDPSVNMLCRENCSKCLPTVATMVLTEIPNDINTKWYHTFRDLSADPCYIVRKAVASVFDDTVKILGSECKLIVPEFAKLLRDDDEEVLQAIVPKISPVLESFAISGVISRDLPLQSMLDIGRALLKCTTQVFKTNNWRMKESLLIQFEILPMVFPSDFIHHHFTQLVLNTCLSGRARPVRSQAARTLLVFLRYNMKENQRKWITESIINQLCNANCCYTRQIYIQLCIHAFNVFSKKFFKEYFYLPLLCLADDPVSVIRLSVIKLCPTLKQMLVLPEDKVLQLKLENMISKMEMIESDIDVIRTLRAKLKDMRTGPIGKTDAAAEEKRKIEEEDKIAKGKMPVKAPAVQTKAVKSEQILPNLSLSKGGSAKYTKKPAPSDMSQHFLDQHFYIDAGVSFTKYLQPDDVNRKSNQTSIPADFHPIALASDTDINKNNNELIASLENIDINSSFMEKDKKTLEIMSDNTNDVRSVNVQNIPKQRDYVRRLKRHSYAFCSDSNESEKKKSEQLLRRRSLNCVSLGDSKIPISSKSMKRLSYSEKVKSASDQNLLLDLKFGQRPSGLPKLLKATKKSERARNSGSDSALDTSYSSNESLNSKDDTSQDYQRKFSSLPIFITRKPIK
ncbi:hypothetical protein GWI33_001948 [Rhynchophorus ferrugineus]|uniref:Serine/threonine-protein phosphatase 4 regulatory subunit 4 n=1 Tax=Rhynchophorus ferrugineus TaxID=354439 RepID=A0A834INE0_RHYFE|nr:hypothetical protein GWI33_001948 [Rhynchophorus ferrugineus]